MSRKDKRKYTERENVFLMKKVFTELVYNTSKFEMVNITLPQTKTLIDGLSVSGVSIDDVQVVLNIKNAFEYILKNHEKPFSLDTALKINSFISYNESLEWGVLRSGKVTISGTDYIPAIPEREKIEKAIERIFAENEDETVKTVRYMYFAMRSQFFWDGNKRTALVSANYIMLNRGLGAIIIPDSKKERFNELLSEFYTTGDDREITEWTIENCMVELER